MPRDATPVTLQDHAEDVVTVEPHDPRWTRRAKRDIETLRLELEVVTLDIEHAGSTSVPGLPAKPTVDLLLGTHACPWDERHDDTLSALGYVFYKAPNTHWRMYLKSWRHLRRGYHLHVVEHDRAHWNDHLRFRDDLRAHPAQAERYGALKQDLAERHATTRGAYKQAKSALVRELEDKAPEWHP
ncbi:GrpB family protein [Deinococcus pimensis]|uniref:GrpB family protein n=1 Tax=Deinococcus pimensis TaxID=309888 RepID=UPI0004B6F94C|nr:GrpB family protein [Deinococcus pimensis]